MKSRIPRNTSIKFKEIKKAYYIGGYELPFLAQTIKSTTIRVGLPLYASKQLIKTSFFVLLRKDNMSLNHHRKMST